MLAHFSCISIFQAGALNDIPVSGKHNSSKVVVVTLLLCVILTTIAFLSSIMCYLYRKRSFSTKTPVFSSEKEESCNSASNLINNITSSVPKTKSSITSHATPFTGWLASLYLSDHCTKYPILFCHRLKLSSSGFFFFPAWFHKAYILFKGKSETIHGTICQFPYVELEYATNSFSDANLIGLGGSSYVYRGQLRSGRIVAIKRLTDHGGPDADSVFLTEVRWLLQ